MCRADRGRLGARDEDLVARIGTSRPGQLSRLATYLSLYHARRSAEVVCRSIGRDVSSLLHEVRPDGQRRPAALDLQIAIVVEPYPHHAQQLAGESGEPA